jgi:protoporphyrinogen oxidase
VTRLCADAGGRVHLSVAGDTACEVFDRVVVTAPTPVFARIAAGALPADYAARYACGAGAVEHYGAHCVVLALSRRFSDAYWLNVNDPGFPFLALVEHTNFMSPEEYAGRHLLYLGNYLPPDHPLFKTPDAEIIDAFLPHLARINPAFDPSWVRRAWVFQAPFAQPLVTRGYSERLPPHETPVPNVLLANMAHVYPQDRGQNYSIRLAEKVAGMF